MNKALSLLATETVHYVDSKTGLATDDSAVKSGALTTDVAGIINGIIGALGIVAVVVIIMGGVSYMTSAGDSSKVKKAKDTILYGVIGLIIVMLSFAIVNWVIGVGTTTE
jgi:tetrahydromethanopterin S-methyltransferase subunit F